MLTLWQDVLIVIGSIGGALLFWWIVRRVWPPERRRLHNEITGWQISVLGTTYAVIVGFMLFAVWSAFQDAERNAESEASCLINLYWSATGLPVATRQEIRKLAADYADEMIDDEWPAMRDGRLTHNATLIIQQLWETASQTQSLSASEQAALEQAMSEIGSVSEHRRIRQLQSEAHLPAILWTVLVIGALITIMSSCLFGSEYPALHMVQVITLALLLSLALAAIADINRPYQGTVHVEPTGFENAKHMFAVVDRSQPPK